MWMYILDGCSKLDLTFNTDLDTGSKLTESTRDFTNKLRKVKLIQFAAREINSVRSKQDVVSVH